LQSVVSVLELAHVVQFVVALELVLANFVQLLLVLQQFLLATELQYGMVLQIR
jgi:hypothetical protein